MKASAIVKSIRLVAGMMLLTSTVHAQAVGGDDGKTQAEIERAKAIEKDYKESLKKIPDAKASNDPWSGVRPAAETPKPPAKPSAKSASAKSSPAKTGKGNGMKPSVFDQ